MFIEIENKLVDIELNVDTQISLKYKKFQELPYLASKENTNEKEFYSILDDYKEKFQKTIKRVLLNYIGDILDNESLIHYRISEYKSFLAHYARKLEELAYAYAKGYKILKIEIYQYANNWVLKDAILTATDAYVTGDNRWALKALYLLPVIDYKTIDHGFEATVYQHGKEPKKIRLLCTVNGDASTMSKYRVEEI